MYVLEWRTSSIEQHNLSFKIANAEIVLLQCKLKYSGNPSNGEDKLLDKIRSNLVAINASDFLTPVIPCNARAYHPSNTRSSLAPRSYMDHPSSPPTVVLWNTLPVSIVTAPSVEVFREGIAASL